MGRSVRAQLLTRRTYCRPLDETETRFETWPLVVSRVIQHQRNLWQFQLGRELSRTQEQELHALERLMLDCKVAPAGRTLWLGGTELAYRRAASQFNCAFEAVRSVHDLVDDFWLLLQGCGVGFEPTPGSLFGFVRPVELKITRSTRAKDERGREDNVETFDSQTGEWYIRVGDSATAWAKSLGKIIANKHPAKILHIDTSEIRGAGSRLKGYGWLSSGDGPLVTAYEAIVKIMNGAAGRLLNRIELLDIVNWLGTLLSSRRSAEIGLCRYGVDEWRDFATAKDKDKKAIHWQREQSNNSIVYYKHPGRNAIREQMYAMFEGGGSEPGIVNGEQALIRAPWYAGLNPCVPGDTRILTSGGYCPIRELVGVDVEVWNGLQWSKVKPFSTGVNPLVEVKFNDGTSLKCTPYHEFVVGDKQTRIRAMDLTAGDTLSTFSMPEIDCIRSTLVFPCDMTEFAHSDYDAYVNGRTDDPCHVLYLTLTERKEWYAAFMEKLNSDGERGQAILKKLASQIRLIETTIGITPKPLVVQEVVDLERSEETFCFTDEHNHTGTFEGIVTGQCAEILLADKGFCNLVTVNLPAFRGDWFGLLEAVRLIARANYRQTCVDLRDGVLQGAWHENNQFLRLCGVSLSGIVQRPDLRPYDYRRLKHQAIFGAYSMADELGLPRPGNVTTIKPEGTISKAVFDCAEGAHRPLGRYIFNNVGFGKHDPLIPMLMQAGYNVRPHPMNDGYLVTIPFDFGDCGFVDVNGTPVNMESATDQFDRYLMLMDNYCEQNVSLTISYDDNELEHLIDRLDTRWDRYVGCSFLKRANPFKTAEDLGYSYLPQEVVTRDRYMEYSSSLKPVDIDSVGGGDIDMGMDCSTGACPVR